MIFLAVNWNTKLNKRTSFNFTDCESFIKLLKISYVPSLQKSGWTKLFMPKYPYTVNYYRMTNSSVQCTCQVLLFLHIFYHYINLSDASYFLSCRHLVVHVAPCDFHKTCVVEQKLESKSNCLWMCLYNIPKTKWKQWINALQSHPQKFAFLSCGKQRKSSPSGRMAGCGFWRNGIAISCWAFHIQLMACLQTEGTLPHLQQG